MCARSRAGGAQCQSGRVTTYMAFLRAVNLGATRKFPKDALRAAVEQDPRAAQAVPSTKGSL